MRATWLARLAPAWGALGRWAAGPWRPPSGARPPGQRHCLGAMGRAAPGQTLAAPTLRPQQHCGLAQHLCAPPDGSLLTPK